MLILALRHERSLLPSSAAGLFLFLAITVLLPISAVMAVELPELTFYQPQGWSGPVVISKATGTHSDDASFAECDTLYLDWAIANFSSVTSAPSFRITLQMDSVAMQVWVINNLPPTSYVPLSDFPLRLSAGIHTVKIIIDSDSTVAEQLENNNEWTRTLTLVAAGTTGSLLSRPVSHGFGLISGRGSAEKIFTVSNAGPGAQEIESISLTGTTPGEFKIIGDACSGQRLPPPECGACASTCTVTVAFSPKQSGTQSASLMFTGTSQTVLLQIPLSGSAETGPGDLNNDQVVSLADSIQALQAMVDGIGNNGLSEQADVDGDAVIGMGEAIFILQLLAEQRPEQQYELVRIQSNQGEILIWPYLRAPLHRDNFLTLVRAGFYDGLIFHRVIDDFMIQGGDPAGTGSGGPGYTICPEFDPGLTHDFGAVAAARTDNPEKKSSGSQFYIVENSGGAHFLDMNYTVFGIVLDGLETVTAIADQPTDDSDRPLVPVVMEKVEIVRYSAAQLLQMFGFDPAGDGN